MAALCVTARFNPEDEKYEEDGYGPRQEEGRQDSGIASFATLSQIFFNLADW